MHPGFMGAVSPILSTCRKLFFKALYMTDATCNVGQYVEQNRWNSLSNKWWYAVESRELGACMQVSRKALFSRHFMQLGRDTVGPWSQGQKQTWKVLWLVVTLSQGKLESSCKHKGTQSKIHAGVERRSTECLEQREARPWAAQSNASLDLAPTSFYSATGIYRHLQSYWLCEEQPANLHTCKFPTRGHNLKWTFSVKPVFKLC